MRVLVFGKTGQVATELAARAPEATFLDRDAADLSNPEACVAAILEARPEAVINAAAYTAVDRAEEEEDLATLINGVTPGALAVACADLGIPFVHISTDYVFAGGGERPWEPQNVTEPLGAYGRSKLVGEQAVTEAGGQYAILRTSWVFSAHGANFLKTMLRLSETRDRLSVVADQIGGPTPAGAIAQAALTVAQGLRLENAGIYHFSGAPDTSWADFARAIFASAERKVEVVDIPTTDYPTPAPRPLNSRLDCSKLATHFDIARPDWKAAMDEIVKELT